MKTKILSALFSMLFFTSYSQNYILDNSFGDSGLVTTSFGPNVCYITSLALQNDGKIIACGNYENGSYNNLIISRYNSNGTLDSSFGVLGKITTSISNKASFPFFRLKLQNDGKILIVGNTGTTLSNSDFVLIRLNNDGTYDNSFGTNGIVITDVNTRLNEAYCIEIQNDNKILIAGLTETITEHENIAVARYNIDGTLDNSFGISGIVNLNIGNSNIQTSIDGINSIKVLSNGKILLGGYTDATSAVEQSNFAIVRLNTDGNLDLSFGNGGKVITDIGAKDEIISLNITSNNEIIASGNIYYPNSITKICMAKYSTNGDIDTSFGSNGIIISQINNVTMNDLNYQTILQNDGKLICTGSSNYDFLIVRYNSNGTLDNSFNSNGYLTTDFFGGLNVAFSLLIQNDGSIIVGGGVTDSMSNVTFGTSKYKIDNLSNNNFYSSKNYKLYPNPAKNSIKICNPNNYIIKEINIFDMLGKNVLKEKIDFNQINIENLNIGIYNLQINSDNNNYNYKFIKE